MRNSFGMGLYFGCLLFVFGRVESAGQQSVDWSRVYRQARPAVVAVFSMQGSEMHVGSGFCVSRDGKVFAGSGIPPNAHLFVRREDGSFLKVEQVQERDSLGQWHILKVSGQPLPALRIASRVRVNVGEAVCIISTRPDGRGKLLAGNITTITTLPNKRTAWEVSVELKESDYGAPVINKAGEVIGIVASAGEQGGCVLPISVVGSSSPARPVPPKSSTASSRPASATSKKDSPFVPLIRLARTIQDLPTRAQTLIHIALLMPEKDPLQLQTVREAESVATKSQEPAERDYILGQVAVAWAQIKHPKEALSTLNRIQDPVYFSQSAYQLVRDAGSVKESAQFLDRITIPYWRGRALSALAWHALREGRIEEALLRVQEVQELAKTTEEAHWRVLLLGESACLLMKIIENNPQTTPSDSTEESEPLAPDLSHCQDQGEALLAEAIRQARENATEDPSGLAELVALLVSYDYTERARSLLKEVGSDKAGEAIGAVALAEIRAGDLEHALTAMKQIGNRDQRSTAYADAVQLLCELGELEKAKEVVGYITSRRVQTQAYAQLAVALVEQNPISTSPAEENASAEALEPVSSIDSGWALSKAEECARAIGDVRWRPEAYAVVGWAYMRANDTQSARQWFEEAMKTAQDSGEPYASMSMARVLYWWARAVAETRPTDTTQPK